MRNVYFLVYNNKVKCKMFIFLQDVYVYVDFISDRCTQRYRTYMFLIEQQTTGFSFFYLVNMVINFSCLQTLLYADLKNEPQTNFIKKVD